MNTKLRVKLNHSDEKTLQVLNQDYKIGIIVSEWNSEITTVLLEGAKKILQKNKVKPKNVIVKYVPGSFELTLGANWLLEYVSVDAVIALGCVIQGETKHFDYICQGVSMGLTKLNMEYTSPIVFGVLTTNTREQAQERAGGKLGNKGEEAAITALKMLQLENELLDEYGEIY